MPTIYDIDYNRQVKDVLPVDKRSDELLSIGRALAKLIQWARDLILSSYRSGSTASPFGAGPYAKYDRVLYNKAEYESLIDSNTDTPDVATSWMLVLPNFIGVEERIQFNAKKLHFEYALNKWFGTEFRQPTSFEPAPDYYLPKSDIFLTNNTIPLSVFRVGLTEDESSSVGAFDSSEAVYDDYDFTTVYGLTINVPLAFWTGLTTVLSDRDQIIRNFADKYIPAGILYNIVTY